MGERNRSERALALMMKNPPAMQETWVRSLVEKIPWRRAWQPTPIFLSGESHGHRSPAGYGPRGHKVLDMTERVTRFNLQRRRITRSLLHGSQQPRDP